MTSITTLLKESYAELLFNDKVKAAFYEKN